MARLFAPRSITFLFWALWCGACQCRAGPVSAPVAVQQLEKGPLQLFVDTIKDARRHLAAAAVARSSSIFLMYPVDTIKVCG